MTEIISSYENDVSSIDLQAALLIDPNNHRGNTIHMGLIRYQGKVFVGKTGNLGQ